MIYYSVEISPKRSGGNPLSESYAVKLGQDSGECTGRGLRNGLNDFTRLFQHFLMFLAKVL